MAGCPPFDPNGPYISSVLAYVDCQGLSLGEAGYRALGAGSAFGMALTGLLTIFVALIGYRLLLGGEFSIRETATTALKLGIVLALATQWSAYRIVIFDVAARQPEQAATGFLAPEGLEGRGSAGLAARFDGVNAALGELLEQSAAVNKGQPSAPPSSAAPSGALATGALPASAEKSIDTTIGMLAVTALAGLLAVRMSMALLLALGPMFIATMLFDATRGFFVGWLRAVAATALAAIAVPIMLAIQLSVLEPQVMALRALLEARQPVSAMPQQIMASAAVFAVVLLALLAVLVRAAAAFRLPEPFRRNLGEFVHGRPPLALPPPEWYAQGMASMRDERSRAQLVAEAAQSIEARAERMGLAVLPPLRLALPHGELPATITPRPVEALVPLGQQGRRSRRRQSPGANRRDELQ
jgi:type IV secretion system protein VirB6